MMKAKIVLLPGDGVGPEVTGAAERALRESADIGGHDFAFAEHPVGGAGLDQMGVPLPEETLAACKEADAVFLGAVGGPKWDKSPPHLRPERGLLALRKELGVFANLRPVKPYPALSEYSPVKNDRLGGTDIMVVRELTGGVYFGEPRRRDREGGVTKAIDTVVYTDHEIERVVALAFRLASGRKKRVTSVDKANVLETSRLWREIATSVGDRYPDVSLDHMLVDAASMRLISSPSLFDVLVTENMFGDILTDEAGVLVGSLGMLPSASLGESRPGLFEPVHGSAPDIAGTGKANPVGAILSAAMLLRHGLELHTEAAALERAVERTLASGARTVDIGGDQSTDEMTDKIIAMLRETERAGT
ncbi:MAG: 3-isopropylmalate dehydrogenase [Bacteroidota bacterium]